MTMAKSSQEEVLVRYMYAGRARDNLHTCKQRGGVVAVGIRLTVVRLVGYSVRGRAA